MATTLPKRKTNWVEGFYFCGEGLRTVLVAIHQLPRTPDTLCLRGFGRGKVQMQAIEELQQLPKSNPFRDRILEIVANMVAILEVREQEQQGLESEEREFLHLGNSSSLAIIDKHRQEHNHAQVLEG